MQRLVITGGAGFIGGNYVLNALAGELFDDPDIEILNLDALTYAGNLQTLASVSGGSNYQFVHASINEQDRIDSCLQNFKPTSIINFAAESHVDRSIDGPAEFVSTNVVGTLSLLQSCLDYWRNLASRDQDKFRFLHVSTDEVYGSLGAEGRFHEETPYAPNSPYAASKAASDHMVRAFFHTYGLPVLTTNCSNNYGPFQFPEKLIPLIILKGIHEQAMPIYGDGKNIRDWLYVKDHCLAISKVLERGEPGEVYNIGGDAEMKNIDVVASICEILDRKIPRKNGNPYQDLIEYVTDRPGHDQRYAIDASKIQSQLGWQADENFKSGIEKTVQWYLDNSPWVEAVLDGSYRGQRLGT